MREVRLINRVSDPRSLRYAWKNLNKQNKYSHGISGITVQKFEENLEEHLSNISKEIRQGIYRFMPNRAVAIQKPNKTYRPLQIPEIRDRVVLKAIAMELENQFRVLLSESKGVSFAYQKGTGIRHAFEKIEEHYGTGSVIILEADIVNFFGTVNKDSLLHNDIFPKLPDDTLNQLITDALNQKVVGVEDLPKAQAEAFKGIDGGIPQGNPLSPLLSNIYLRPFDDFAIARGSKMVRYADDFVVMCSSKEDAQTTFNEMKKFLRDRLKLNLYDLGSKSSITNPKSNNFVFLSIQFDGLRKFPSLENVEKFKNKIRSVCNTSTGELSVIELLTKVKNRYEGWLSAFFFTDVDRYEKGLDYFIDRQLFLALAKMDWKFSSGSKGSLPYEYRQTNESKDCLSKGQRFSSGVPRMSTHLIRIRQEEPNQIDTAKTTDTSNRGGAKMGQFNLLKKFINWFTGK